MLATWRSLWHGAAGVWWWASEWESVEAAPSVGGGVSHRPPVRLRGGTRPSALAGGHRGKGNVSASCLQLPHTPGEVYQRDNPSPNTHPHHNSHCTSAFALSAGHMGHTHKVNRN
ncbi:hypothetical protein AAFF_G00147100 [Aldrovandia affinis]|uniref:Secreted protein n=1 Tax=Aldrovandia affinis TaxID=143900 RepID=A0AAD7W8S7_9TELE|nr:hypothetical protein AAFF_G00147100 [Aldrovandia affinis]